VTSSATALTTREGWEFDPELAREDLTRTYGIASLDGLGVGADDGPAIGAAGALLRYARELKPGGLPHLAHPTIVRRGDVLPLDEMTRRNLELVEPLRSGGDAEGATLLGVIDRTLTPMGGRLLRRWLLAPLVEPAAINARLDAVAVLVGDGRGRERLREALDGVRDLERLAGRAHWDGPRRARWAPARFDPAAAGRGRRSRRVRRPRAVRPARSECAPSSTCSLISARNCHARSSSTRRAAR